MNGFRSSAGGQKTLQFVTPAAPPPAPDLEDDVWGEELPEEALQEAILLESQQCPDSRAQPTTSHRLTAVHGRQPDQQASAGVGEPSAPLPEVQRLQRDNALLVDQLRAAKTDIYTHQGKVSVLREELTRRCRELENCRLESSRQIQEQQHHLEQSTHIHTRELDALRTELQFKTHELSEVTRQFRALRDSPARGCASPPRKAARLGCSAAASPSAAGQRRFITGSEFRRPETGAARTESAGTQTESDCQATDIVDSEVAPCRLVAAVLRASGDALWLGGGPLSALSALADRASLCTEEEAGRAADQVVAAAAAQLAQFPACVKRFLAAVDTDRRLYTLGSGRRRAAALLSVQQEQAVAVTALSALLQMAEWDASLADRLACHPLLLDLLPRLLRPVIAEGEVMNVLMMEYTADLLAAVAVGRLPDCLIHALEPALHEVFNTKPPADLLSALLDLLIGAAGTGQISELWCRARSPPPVTRHTGTCLVKKLSILYSERAGSPAAAVAVAGASYRLPASHSRHAPAAGPPMPAALLRQQLDPAQSTHSGTVSVSAADGPVGCRWVRLVALVMSRPAALPARACCRAHLTLLVVQLLYQTVHVWEYGGDGDVSATLHLLSALHRLADLDPAFSSSVSRERLRYLATMETLGRCWKSMQLPDQHVGVLQELYKFQPGTFDETS